MPSFSKHDVILVRYPFSDLTGVKVRPAIVVSAAHVSKDIFIVPLTSKMSPLLSGEFPLAGWREAGLNVPTSIKRGLYTVHESLVVKKVGKISNTDANILEASLRAWLDL